jgi:hypothetical protein
MKKYLSIWIILLLAGMPGTKAQEKLVAGKNNVLSVNSFTITFPEKYLERNAKWTIRKKSDEFDIIELAAIDESGIPLLAYTMKKYTMEFFMDSIKPESLIPFPNDSIAAYFFNNQLKMMIEKDAQDKNYVIRDHQEGSDSINGKLFHTFNYAVYNKKGGYVLLGYLYIYFPKDSNNEEFFVSYFSEPINFAGYKKGSKAKWLDCFHEILGTLVIKEKSTSQ